MKASYFHYLLKINFFRLPFIFFALILNNSTQQRSSRKVQTYLNSQNARAWKVLLLNFIRYRLFLKLLGRERELKR